MRSRQGARSGGRTSLTTDTCVLVASGDCFAAVEATHTFLAAFDGPNMQAKGTCTLLVGALALHKGNVFDELCSPHKSTPGPQQLIETWSYSCHKCHNESGCSEWHGR